VKVFWAKQYPATADKLLKRPNPLTGLTLAKFETLPKFVGLAKQYPCLSRHGG